MVLWWMLLKGELCSVGLQCVYTAGKMVYVISDEFNTC